MGLKHIFIISTLMISSLSAMTCATYPPSDDEFARWHEYADKYRRDIGWIFPGKDDYSHIATQSWTTSAYLKAYRRSGNDLYRDRAIWGLEKLLKRQYPDGSFFGYYPDPWYKGNNHDHRDSMWTSWAAEALAEGFLTVGDERCLSAAVKSGEYISSLGIAQERKGLPGLHPGDEAIVESSGTRESGDSFNFSCNLTIPKDGKQFILIFHEIHVSYTSQGEQIYRIYLNATKIWEMDLSTGGGVVSGPIIMDITSYVSPGSSYRVTLSICTVKNHTNYFFTDTYGKFLRVYRDSGPWTKYDNWAPWSVGRWDEVSSNYSGSKPKHKVVHQVTANYNAFMCAFLAQLGRITLNETILNLSKIGKDFPYSIQLPNGAIPYSNMHDRKLDHLQWVYWKVAEWNIIMNKKENKTELDMIAHRISSHLMDPSTGLTSDDYNPPVYGAYFHAFTVMGAEAHRFVTPSLNYDEKGYYYIVNHTDPGTYYNAFLYMYAVTMEPTRNRTELHISSLSLSKENVGAGEDVKITAEISNNGGADLESATLYFYYNDVRPENRIDRVQIGKIPAGTKMNVNTSWSPEKIGEMKIYAVITNASPPESYIWNNTAYSYINVVPSPLPDISVKDMEFSNENPVENDRIVIKTTLSNLGDKTSPPFIIRFYCDNNPVSEKSIDYIDPGDDETVEFEWVAVCGTHMLKISADPDNKIKEYSENNNIIERNITVRVKPIHRIRAYIQFRTMMINPGDNVTFTATVENIGNVIDVINISVQKLPENWSYSSEFPVTLMSAEQKMVKIIIVASKNARSGNHTIDVIFYSENDENASVVIGLTVVIRQIWSLEIYSEKSHDVFPEGYATFNVSVKNLGNGRDVVSISVENLTEGWSWKCSPNERIMKPLESANFTVNIFCPGNIFANHIEYFKIIAISSIGKLNFTESFVIVLPLHNITSTVKYISSMNTTKTFSWNYLITIKNAGNIDETVSVLTESMCSVSLNRERAVIGAFSEADFIMTISLNRKTPAGKYLTVINIISDSGIEIVDSITVEIPQIHSIRISVEPADIICIPGEKISINLTINNLGNVDERITLNYSAPHNICVMMNESLLLMINESISTTMMIKIPKKIPKGRYEIKIIATANDSKTYSVINITISEEKEGDEKSSDENQIDVHVAAGVIVFVIAICIISFIIISRKFK